ncbi:N,N-dimethylaniline monooxygenase [Aureococcus anophagefferens]|nr:N,N-dimethylaniline monooxygenase [Aureococcus anophagefferens]
MCLRCLGRALKYVKSVEWAVTSTGGAAIAALQVVHHKHCPDPNCENEGHCHIRVRRVDGTSGAEWVRANGTLDQCRESIGRCFKGVPIDVFDEIFEADERGLSRECLDLVEAAAAARHGAVASSSSSSIAMAGILVVGLGPCGLAAVKECAANGLDVVGVDAAAEIGGVFRAHDDGCYEGLHLTTSNVMMAFGDFPPNDGWIKYSTKDEYAAYLKRYVDTFDLAKRLELRTKVIRASRDNGAWKVVTLQ